MKTKPNEAAFSGVEYVEQNYPLKPREVYTKGLTKREYFAAMAMSKMAEVNFNDAHPIEVAEKAVRYADALIAELNKEYVK